MELNSSLQESEHSSSCTLTTHTTHLLNNTPHLQRSIRRLQAHLHHFRRQNQSTLHLQGRLQE